MELVVQLALPLFANQLADVLPPSDKLSEGMTVKTPFHHLCHLLGVYMMPQGMQPSGK